MFIFYICSGETGNCQVYTINPECQFQRRQPIEVFTLLQ